MAIEAMNVGKHVYVEKPLAMNRNEAESMIAAAKKYGVQLMVGHLLQYHPVFMAIRELVESGGLGGFELCLFKPVERRESALRGGCGIWSFAPHDISMILSLIGEGPEVISGVFKHSTA